MNIRAIIVDDEPLAVLELQAMLTLHHEVEIVATAHDANSAKIAIESLTPSLVFLDINMPGKNGFELLEDLRDIPEVIFVTAYDQYAIKAFEVNALDYILKPVNPERLAEALAKVIKKLSASPVARELTIEKRIFIKDGEQCYFAPLSKVFLIESVGNYVRVFYEDNKPMLHKSMNYMEEKLPEEYFFRVSRQFIININFIKNIVPYFNSTLQVELFNGSKFDISQRQSVRFKERMGI